MANHAVQLMQHNGLADRVTVVKGAIEELDLPPQSVDVMIRSPSHLMPRDFFFSVFLHLCSFFPHRICSEWMGYFLLRESMLDSLVRARNRLLKPGGVMMPSSATMLWAPIECEDTRQQKERELADSLADWDVFTADTATRYGVDMGCLAPSYRKEQRDYFSLSSQWTELLGEQVVATPVVVKHLDLHRQS